MIKLLRGIIITERIFQIAALFGLILFFGYLGLTNIQRGQTPAPSVSPTQQK
jgi:hypothetical protein